MLLSYIVSVILSYVALIFSNYTEYNKGLDLELRDIIFTIVAGIVPLVNIIIAVYAIQDGVDNLWAIKGETPQRVVGKADKPYILR